MSTTSDEENDSKCEDLDVLENVLPENSKEKYLIAYQNFIQWKNAHNVQPFTEDVFMEYFKELSSKYKPTSLWSIFSMLNSTVRTKHGVDIKQYSNLSSFMKGQSVGYRSKKSKVLMAEDVEKFIREAPDDKYLATKVAVIFCITGSCRAQELTTITVKDIENHGQMLLVKVPIKKNKIRRSFTIHGPFYDIVKKYESLRSPKAKHGRFFLNYQNGKCTSQPIGVNKFCSMPKEIARYLGLPDPQSYTGHSFRKTSLVSNNSNNVGDTYRKDSKHIQIKKEICPKIIKTRSLSSDSEEHTTGETPGTSNANDYFSSTYTNNEQSQNLTIEYENITLNNLPEIDMSSKVVTYKFINCKFINCFSKRN